MKLKYIVLLLGLIFSLQGIQAQTNPQSFSLTPVVFYENSAQQEIKPQIRKQLKNKLMRIITENGMASSEIRDRFILFPDVQIVTKDVVPSAPPKVSLTLEISFYIADFDEKKIFASESFEYRGVGNNDTKAMISAVRRINPNDKLNAFIAKGKQAILDYYEDQCESIIRDAQVKVETGRERDALYTLTRVPMESTCFDRVAEEIIPIYVKFENKECAKHLAKAQSIWNSTQSYEGAMRTESYFSRILPGMDCYDEAVALMNDMKTTLKVKDMREWEYRMTFAEERAQMLEWIFNKYYELELAKARNYNSWWR